MKNFFILAFSLFVTTGLFANDCYTAATLRVNDTTTVALDNTCNFGPASQKLCAGCIGDAWFKWVPGGTNTQQYNVNFRISVNGNSAVNIYVLYSESVDAGNPCEWNANTEGYSQYKVACNANLTANTAISFNNYALDGSGTFFVLVEKRSGSATSVSVTPILFAWAPTCNAPSNDRCTSPTQLTSGNGIDPGAAAGNSTGAWSASFSGSNKCATKQRMFNHCSGGVFNPNPPTPTEDHYGRNQFGTCTYRGNLGDIVTTFNTDQCDFYLESTVFYSFQVPVSANDWYIHFASPYRCQQNPDYIAAMLFSSLDCNNARNSNRIACGKFDVNGQMPTPDHTWGPLSLNAGQTYYIVVDGTRGSQCDFNMLITRTINTVLPVRLSDFTGFNDGPVNHLSWETESEEGFHYFEIESSLPGGDFQSLGRVMAAGENGLGAGYQFTDPNPEVGTTFYRMKMVDIDGQWIYSPLVEVFRTPPAFGLETVYPNPTRDVFNLRINLPEQDQIEVSLRDLAGREHLVQQYAGNAGGQELVFPVEQLPAGLYFLQVRFRDKRVVTKVVKY